MIAVPVKMGGELSRVTEVDLDDFKPAPLLTITETIN
jgi:hypothetical protein